MSQDRSVYYSDCRPTATLYARKYLHKMIYRISFSETSKKVLKLSLPLAGSRLLSTVTGFLGMVLLSRYDVESLAASALISSTQLLLLSAGMAVLFSTSILVGHCIGSRQFFKISCILHQAIVLSLLISILLIIAFWFVGPILLLLHQPEYLVRVVSKYFRVFSFGVPAILILAVIQQSLFAMQKQMIAFSIELFSLILTVLLGTGFIYGQFGLPEFGIVGLAYAIVIQAWFLALSFMGYLAFSSTCEHFKFFKVFSIDKSTILSLFYIGWPISVNITGEILSLFVITIMAGWIGITTLNALQIVLQYLLLLVIPIFGISQAIAILSSHLIGANQSNLITRFGNSAIKLGCLFTFIALVTFILFPAQLASVFLNDSNIPNIAFTELIFLLLLIVTIGQFFDLLRNICSGSLRSMNINIQPMLIGMIYIWLFSIPLAYILGFNCKFGLLGIMTAYNIGTIFAGINLYILWRRRCNHLNAHSSSA